MIAPLVYYAGGWKDSLRTIDGMSSDFDRLEAPTRSGGDLVVSGSSLFAWPHLELFLQHARTRWHVHSVTLRTDSLFGMTEESVLRCTSLGLQSVHTAAAVIESPAGGARRFSREHIQLASRLIGGGTSTWLELSVGWPAIQSHAAIAAIIKAAYRGAAGLELRRGRFPGEDLGMRQALVRNPSLVAESIAWIRSELEQADIPVVLELDEGIPPCIALQGPDRVWPFGVGHSPGCKKSKRTACDRCQVSRECPGAATALAESGLPTLFEPVRWIPLAVLANRMTRTSPEQYGVWRGAPKAVRASVPFGEYLRSLQNPNRTTELEPAIDEADYEALGACGLDGFRVTLFVPPGAVDEHVVDKNSCLPPLALVHLASFLRAHGCEVRTHDLYVSDCFSAPEHELLSNGARLRSALAGKPDPELDGLLGRCVARLGVDRTDLIGMSSGTEEDLAVFVLILRKARAEGRKVPAVVGRYFPVSRQLEAHVKDIDYVVDGDGEIPLLLLCASLASGASPDWIPGMRTFDGGHSRGHRRIHHALDIMPPPDFGGLELGRYRYELFTGWRGTTLPYQFIQGCPFRCSFCSTPQKQRYRRRRPELVVRDLVHMRESVGVSQFFFLNNMFNVDLAWCDEVLDRMIGAGGPFCWTDSARPSGMQPDIFAKMRRAGCDALTFGLDATSDRLSRMHHKHLRQEEVMSVLRASAEAGILNHVNIVPGLPGETDVDVDDALRFLRTARPWIGHVTVSPFNLIELSDLARLPERFGLARCSTGLGVDVVGGPTWEQQQEHTRRAARRLADAARDMQLMNGRRG